VNQYTYDHDDEKAMGSYYNGFFKGFHIFMNPHEYGDVLALKFGMPRHCAELALCKEHIMTLLHQKKYKEAWEMLNRTLMIGNALGPRILQMNKFIGWAYLTDSCVDAIVSIRAMYGNPTIHEFGAGLGFNAAMMRAAGIKVVAEDSIVDAKNCFTYVKKNPNITILPTEIFFICWGHPDDRLTIESVIDTYIKTGGQCCIVLGEDMYGSTYPYVRNRLKPHGENSIMERKGLKLHTRMPARYYFTSTVITTWMEIYHVKA